MIKQIITGLMVGIFATITFMQYDPWVHAQMGSMFTDAMSQIFDCEVRGTVRTVNFLMPEIVFDDFAMIQKKEGSPDWQWHAKTYRTGFSWLDVVVNNCIKMWIAVDQLEVTSAIVDNAVAIHPHIQDLLSPPNLPIPLSIHNGYVKKGALIIEGASGTTRCSWHLSAHCIANKIRCSIAFAQGVAHHNGLCMLEHATGSIIADVYDDAVVAKVNGQADLCNLGDHPQVQFNGTWNNKSARFSVESLDKSLHIHPIIITHKNNKQWFEATAKFPASYASFLLANYSGIAEGECVMSVKGTADFLDGHFLAQNIKNILIGSPIVGSSSFSKRGSRWFGNIDVRLPQNRLMRGSFKWDDHDQTGNAQMINSTPLNIVGYPYWQVPKNACMLTVDRKKSSIVANSSVSFFNELHNLTRHATAQLHADCQVGSYTVNGNAQDIILDAVGHLNTYPYIDSLYCYRNKKKPYIKFLHNDENNTHEGVIQIPTIRAAVQHLLGYDIQGEGLFEFNTRCENYCFDTQFHLKNGTIRLPQTFNFINGIDGTAEFDMVAMACTLKDITCRLHTGMLTVPHGVVHLDKAGSLAFSHIPLLLDHCLLNLKQDLFAVVSGAVALGASSDQALSLKGSLFLDRAQLKENIFSELFQKNLFQAADAMQTAQGVALACDLTIASKDPIKINTGFLDAQAQVDLAIQKQVTQPEITGSISLLSGALEFPYKSLHISRGTISFIKDQPLNPHIELVAKNNLRQHNIVLHVNGSLRDHFVLLESTPPLSDEQIIGLLLAGSHEESLSAIIPSLLVQNVTNIIFSADQSGFLDRYVKPWLKQINVHLVPKFSEESGRGGLRGSLEIDVNERWRALIEKNFSLTEDTRFELEYLLSDDVRLRVIRDERCDVGAEVEMKWKF